jgi:hypothetical protein
MAGKEGRARSFQNMHDIHAFAHEIVFEHSIWARIGLGSLGSCKTELSSSRLIAQVVIHDHCHIRVGSGRVYEVHQADSKRVTVSHG